ncbi:hypothetical protein ACJ7VE_39310 [Streptomyces sp. PB17]|uniref:hypothetical protein n=1 Tax=Streptomyces sp. PB17 TaxID=3384158 RepID=UPI0038B5639C
MAETVARQILKVRWKQPYPNVPVTPEVRKLADIQIPEGFVAKVVRFLAVLEISCKPPERESKTDVNIQRLLVPAVEYLQLARALRHPVLHPG